MSRGAGPNSPALSYVIHEDPRTTTFMQLVPKDMPIISLKGLLKIPGIEEMCGGLNTVSVISYRSKVYALKSAKVCIQAFNEADP